MKKLLNRRILLSISFLLIFFPFLIAGDNATYMPYIYINYLLQLLVFGFVVKSEKNQFKTILTPSCLCSLYLITCFIIGDLLLRAGLFIDPSHFAYYSGWSHSQLSTSYYNACFFLAYITKDLSKPIRLSTSFSNKPIEPNFLFGIVSLITMILCLCWGMYFEAEGPTIEFPIIFATLSAICLFYMVKDKPLLFRICVYIAIILLFAVFRFSNKREAIFLIIPILFLESRHIKDSAVITLKNIIISALAIVIVTILIVIMSIQRIDHKNQMTEVVNLMEILYSFSDYLTPDRVMPLLANNFEIDYVYVNSHQSIEFIEEDPSNKTWGMTYIKPLVAPIPRAIMPDKPEAAMILYTKKYDPEKQAEGFCLPLSLQAEGYWNFGYLGGLICVFIIFYLFNSVYLKLYDSIINDYGIKTIFNAYIYYIFFLLYRDSGFTKLLTFSLAAFIFCFVLSKIAKRKKCKRNVILVENHH